MDIFVPIRFRTSIQLTPSDLIANFEQVILDKVKASLEGVCSRYGYIRPGSIIINKRSAGVFVKQHFNGHIKFDMVCRAEVCNPGVGAVFQAVVKNKNALGIHAESTIVVDDIAYPVLDIIIPKRSAGIKSSVDLDTLNVGDSVNIEVLGKRYQLNDKKISIIARAIQDAPNTSSGVETIVRDDDEEVFIPEQVDMDLLDEDEDEQDDDDTEDDNDRESNEDNDADAFTEKEGGEEEEEDIQEDYGDDIDSEDVISDDYDNDDSY